MLFRSDFTIELLEVNYSSDYSVEMLVDNNTYYDDDLQIDLPKNRVTLYNDTSFLDIYNKSTTTIDDLIELVKSNNKLITEMTNFEVLFNSKFGISLSNAISYYSDLSVDVEELNQVKFKYNNETLTQEKIKKTMVSYPKLFDYTIEYELVNDSSAQDVIIDLIQYRKSLSLLDILLEEIPWWSVGSVDKSLTSKINRLSIEEQDVYSVLTQDVSEAYECFIEFDTINCKINVYDINTYSKETNIYLDNENLLSSFQIDINSDNIYTTFYVSGGDSDSGSNLYINQVNPTGSNLIEDISYFLNDKYLDSDTIENYNSWKSHYDSCFSSYMSNYKLYNNQLETCNELLNRVPLDDCNKTNISTCSDEELLEMKNNYEALQLGYESLYVDEDGAFDLDAIKTSVDWNDYSCVINIILPNIEIEYQNRQLTSEDDYVDYVDDYLTNWDLYGVDELKSKLKVYENEIAIAKSNGYNKAYTTSSKYSEEQHEKLYESYTKTCTLIAECE